MAHGLRAGAHPEVSPLPSARAVKISSWIPAQGRDDTEQNYRQRPRICPLHHASRGPPPPLCGGGPPTVGTGRGARSSPVHGGGGPAQPVEGAAENANLSPPQNPAAYWSRLATLGGSIRTVVAGRRVGGESSPSRRKACQEGPVRRPSRSERGGGCLGAPPRAARPLPKSGREKRASVGNPPCRAPRSLAMRQGMLPASCAIGQKPRSCR